MKIRWTRALLKRGPGFGKLDQEPDSQGALMEAGWATS